MAQGILNTCRWIKADSSGCGKPVKYKMVWDGGEIGSTKVRQYDPFCEEHKARLATRKSENIS